MSNASDREDGTVERSDASPAADTASGEQTSDDAKGSATSGRKNAREKVRTGSDAVRSGLASILWLIAVTGALLLSIGALLVSLDANEQNSAVQLVLAGADYVDGPFSRENGPFTFDGPDAATRSALVNWGIGAIVFLIVGKVLDRTIRP